MGGKVGTIKMVEEDGLPKMCRDTATCKRFMNFCGDGGGLRGGYTSFNESLFVSSSGEKRSPC